MTIEAATTAFGRPAIELLARRIHELKGGDPLAPVTVVVPSNYAAVAARRALAARPNGVVNVTFLTLHRLAERIGGPVLAGRGRRPTSTPVITAAVRAVLDDAPGVFAPVAGHPATEQALVAAHRELSDVTEGALDGVATCSPSAADVVRIHRATRDRLAPNWFDEADLLAAAAVEVRARPESIGAGLGPVVLHLVDHLTAAGVDLVTALRAATDVRVDVGVTGDPMADAAVFDTYARAGITIEQPALEAASADHLVSASDPDDEVRAAVRLVTQWMHGSVPLGRVAVLYPLADPYARLLHEQLTAAGIPFNGAPVRAVGDLLFGRTLRRLLELPDRNYRRPDVLALLTGAPLLDGDVPLPGRRWERVSRDAGIVDGDDWDARLETYADRLRRRATEADDDDQERRADSFRIDAARADDLRDFVRRLRDDLDAGHRTNTWAGLVAWATRLIVTYLGDERHRAAWPDEERAAADRIEEALDRLAGLDELGGPPPTVDVFRRALDGELSSALRRVRRLGDGVLVGPLSMATGLVLDRVVVLGMAEGVFPPRRLEDSLLPDDERVAANGELALRAGAVDEDRRRLLAALAASDVRVLCQPRGDLRRAGERPPSRWFLAAAASLAGVPAVHSDNVREHAGAPWLDHVASFAGGLARAELASTDQQLRLAAVARGLADHAVLRADEVLQRGLAVVRARASDEFTRFDGNLASVARDIGRPQVASATRLQTWAACPHAYLLEHVLDVAPIEEPERRLVMNALDKGSLVHEILDTFVRGAIDAHHPFDRWTGDDRARLHAIAEAAFAEYESQGLTGRPLFWERDRDRIRADLDRFLELDNERLAAGISPIATEHRFDEVPVTLPSGHVLRVRGSIDRVDRRHDGLLAVLDYKTGRDTGYTGLSEANPHEGGTLLQLYLYAAAARAEFGDGDAPVDARYWFASNRGEFRLRGYLVTNDVAADVEDALDTIVEGIAAGVFPAHPAAQPAWKYVDCWYCTPDGLSGSDRRREWERKRGDAALARYAALAEPEEVAS